MRYEYVRKAWAKDLEAECKKVFDTIKKDFGIELTGLQTSKIVAWKSKNSIIHINQNQLLKILGGKI